jgi:SAM-dependent methyltransferase
VSLEALFRLHTDLPREAPGSEEETLAALARVRPLLPARPRVADLGCGTGPATLPLARALMVPVLALDLHLPYLRRLQVEAARRGLGARVRPVRGDLAALPLAPGSLDLLGCEGAAYVLGLGPALGAWRPLLAPGGVVVLTECCWLGAARPAEAAAFWAQDYPAMTSLEGCQAAARAAGFRVLGARLLPADAWEAYYGPLRARAAALRPAAAGDPDLAAVLHETERELAVWERSAGSYGYAWLELQREP